MKSLPHDAVACRQATEPFPVLQEKFHPNELDLRRIMRLLGKRSRYQYVSPRVEAVEGGYRVVSPCCSRNIDSEGGTIDIAQLAFDPKTRVWSLQRKDHLREKWQVYARSSRLDHLMAYLNEDPDRIFWQ